MASSEIFPTWPTAALYANIYAQISFALNRVYTVWYRSRGFDFDITNSTAFDQYFVYGRNIFGNISLIVDNIFNMFLRRQGRREPFFAQYCNGTTSTCNGMSQWGSYDLANKGYDPMQILRYYYPSDVRIVESNSFTSAVGSYGGVVLREGASGEDVRTMQNYLNRIRTDYPLIPQITNPNGFFGASTTEAVKVFQQAFHLIPDGLIGKATWYKISSIYVGVKRLAELDSEGERLSIGKTPPTVTIQMGSRGEYVVELQFLLNFIGSFFPEVPFVIEDARFGDSTKRAVIEFQKTFGLTPDGIVGPATWQKLYNVYNSIEDSVVIPPSPPGDVVFPGTALRLGSRSEDVRLMQQYLNAISKVYTSIPSVTADGVFGQNTQAAVIAFQRQFGLSADGVIGRQTWDKIVSVYNTLPGGGTPVYPGTPLRLGSRGESVRLMQSFLRDISTVFPVVPMVTADGVFGVNTQSAVIAFQRFFGLTPDGVIGQQTWNKIVSVHDTMPNVAAPQYPGTALRLGSSGNDVIIMQKYLAAIAREYPSIPTVTADGVFGNATQSAVSAFQKQFGLTVDGVIGRQTWNMIVSVFNSINISSLRDMSVNVAGHGYNHNQSSGVNPMMMLLALKMGRMF